MAESLSFGAPSSIEVWADGPIALGRVGIAPAGSTPPDTRLHRAGRVTATADLRLPSIDDDDAAHAALFRAFGRPDFPESLDGDFALALWDAGRGTLTLARDRVGIRPLFLARTRAGAVAFASFPDALIDAGIVLGRFDPAAFVDMLMGAGAVSARSWIEGIERVEPGHLVTVSSAGETRRRYWRYPAHRRGGAPDNRDLAARALRDGLETAVARALPAGSAPVCAYLSGGLDSGAIVGLAAGLTRDPATRLTAYCVSAPARDDSLDVLDEVPAARSVAEMAGVPLVTYPFDMMTDGLMRRLARTVNAFDTPDGGYERILADAASRGADRILCGFGGDEVVSYSGAGAPLADFVMLRWRALRRTAAELNGPLWRKLAYEATVDLLPPRIDRLLRRALGKGHRGDGLDRRPVRPGVLRDLPWTPGIGHARRQRARLEQRAFQHRLEVQAWEAARHGMRTVFPMLDWRLLERAADLPARLQIEDGKGRALLRRAVEDLLPAGILRRREKLAPFPTLLYDISAQRPALLAELRRLAASPAANAVIDLGEVERQLTALPAPETVAAAMRAAAAQGRQLRDGRETVYTPFQIARALAQNEADCAARAGAPPRAA